MPTRHRKKRYALLAFLLGVYGCAFVSVVFKEDRNPSPRAVDAHAEDISCERNWFVLGATWNCRATVVTPDGKRHPYSSFASALTPDDVGHRVEMTRTNVKGEGRYFTPTRPRDSLTWAYLPGFVGSLLLAVGGPIALWPRRDKAAFAAMTPADKLARARALRGYSWTLVAVVVAALLAAVAAYQVLSASSAKWFIIPVPLLGIPSMLAVPALRMAARDHEKEAAQV